MLYGHVTSNPVSIRCRSRCEVYTDDIPPSRASNPYQRTILLSSTGIILAGKSFPILVTPRAVRRAYIHLAYPETTIPVGNRDLAVGNVTNQTQPILASSLTNTSVFQGQTAFNGYTYSTTVTYVPGLLKNSSDGVNHAGEVSVTGRYAIDGLVSVFEAHIVGNPTPVNASS